MDDDKGIDEAISKLKTKKLKGTMKIHDCGHEDGKPCTNEVDL
jgi:hypothetical protein